MEHMDTEDTSSTFDGHIATALLVGPLVPLMLHTHAPSLLLPTLIAATISQFAVQSSRGESRRRLALLVGLVGINAMGWPLYAFQ